MTTDRDGNRSNPYKPNPEKCCEACIFGSGEHAPFCPEGRLVTCAKCGGPMWVAVALLPYYYDCGLSHAGDCPLSLSPPEGDISGVKHA